MLVRVRRARSTAPHSAHSVGTDYLPRPPLTRERICSRACPFPFARGAPFPRVVVSPPRARQRTKSGSLLGVDVGGVWTLATSLAAFSITTTAYGISWSPSPVALGALECNSCFTHDLSATTDGFVRARALTSVISLASSHGFGLERLHALSLLVHCPVKSIPHSPVTRLVDPSAFLLPASSLEVVAFVRRGYLGCLSLLSTRRN